MSALFEISDDPERLDRDWIWRTLSTEAYWGLSRSRADVDRQLDGAWRVVGAYDAASGEQIGFARAVSDSVAFAYLADVIVDPGRRGEAIGKGMLRLMIDEGPGARFRWILFTRDAHGLYEKFGFVEPDATAMVRPAG